MQVTGITGALMELLLFYLSAHWLRSTNNNLQKIDVVSYYWLCFTVLTGFWESVYILCYGKVVTYASQLREKDQHVWKLEYPVTMIIPSSLSKVFYAEYGAWADREYMSRKDDWSRLIESTHALFCGLFSLQALLLAYFNSGHIYVAAGVAMGSQMMNSILYMGQYFLQCHDPKNVNYNTSSFPTGKWLSERPFMWVNIFWMIMPAYVVFTTMYHDQS
jgi:hypothetical protein